MQDQNTPGSYELLDELASKQGLGFLGRHILQTIDEIVAVPRIIGKMETNPNEVYDYLRQREITVGFSCYRSSMERDPVRTLLSGDFDHLLDEEARDELERIADEGSNPRLQRNFTLYSEIKDSEFQIAQMHFYWRGSFEGLETEMRRDVTTLNNGFLFQIHFAGYNPEGNVSI
jgi:hypothetical protein